MRLAPREAGANLGRLAALVEQFSTTGRPIRPQDIGNYGVLKPQAPGSQYYFVGMRSVTASDGFPPILNDNGEPLVFDMRELVARKGYIPSARGGEGYVVFREQLFRETERIRRQVEAELPAEGAPPLPPRARRSRIVEQ